MYVFLYSIQSVLTYKLLNILYRFLFFLLLIVFFHFKIIYVCADLYVVEFQKRGLPHIHSIVWLKLDTENPTLEMINSFISAEIPDYKTDTLAYTLVEEFMVHGPCGVHNPKSPCMKNGVCSKKYPKEYNDETTIDALGFPVYRRRNNGRFVMKNGIPLDNRWIVPHNISLLKKFQAHINVEWCNKTNLLKYLFKYLAKIHDMSRARTHVPCTNLLTVIQEGSMRLTNMLNTYFLFLS